MDSAKTLMLHSGPAVRVRNSSIIIAVPSFHSVHVIMGDLMTPAWSNMVSRAHRRRSLTSEQIRREVSRQ